MTDPALKIDLVPDRNADLDLALVAQVAPDLDPGIDPDPVLDLHFRSEKPVYDVVPLYFSHGAHAGSLLISKAIIGLCVSVELKFEARKIPKQGFLERGFLLSFNDKSASLICFDCKMTGTTKPAKGPQTFETADAP